MIRTLTIAGSDPSGGAGIQADLKTFSALGAYGMSVITALTAQNTQGVDNVYPIPSDFVIEQLRSIMCDITVDSLKIGMLMNKEIVEAVSCELSKITAPYIVLDTVMVAKGGHPLLLQNAVEAIRDKLLPLATVITPNLPEAAALLDCDEATDEDQMLQQGKKLLALGCKAVLIKGGHLSGSESIDYLLTAEQTLRLTASRVLTKNSHGTGCTLSAAIAALLPKMPLENAVIQAKEYLTGALQHANELKVGDGIGPTHHFYRWW